MNELTIAQVAAQLALTPRRVRAIIRSGRLPAEKVGRDWFIKPEDLEAYKSTRRKSGRPHK